MSTRFFAFRCASAVALLALATIAVAAEVAILCFDVPASPQAKR